MSPAGIPRKVLRGSSPLPYPCSTRKIRKLQRNQVFLMKTIQNTQLNIFGITPSQNTFNSPTWGELTFFPVPDKRRETRCLKCLLAHTFDDDREITECDEAPCIPQQRNDGKFGYYSIHQMPDFDHLRNKD